jgi:hypothetical protein
MTRNNGGTVGNGVFYSVREGQNTLVVSLKRFGAFGSHIFQIL